MTIHISKTRNGFAIIAAIVILFVFSALGVIGLSLLASDAGSSIYALLSSRAFFIAEGGLQNYFELLQNQASSWVTPPAKPVDKALAGGTFTITTSNEHADYLKVISTANIPGPENDTVVRVVSTYVSRLSGPGRVPDAFKYQAYVEHHINFTKGSGGNNIVNGDLRAEMNITWDSGWTINGDTFPDSPLAFPYVDFDSYRTWVLNNYGPTHVISGNLALAVGQVLNGVYFVEGNVTFADGVTLNGGMVTLGVINMRNKNGITINGGNGLPALVAQQTLDASGVGDTHINGRGLIYSEQGVNFDRALGSTFTGTFCVRINMNVANDLNCTFSFDPGIVNNPPPFFALGYPGTVNWDEVY